MKSKQLISLIRQTEKEEKWKEEWKKGKEEEERKGSDFRQVG